MIMSISEVVKMEKRILPFAFLSTYGRAQIWVPSHLGVEVVEAKFKAKA
jgi:hypothetical protein